MGKRKWDSVEEQRRWFSDFRSWLFAMMEMIRTQIREQGTDAVLPEKRIIERAIYDLHVRSNSPMLIDSEFRSSMTGKLREIAMDIAACEIAQGRGIPAKEKLSRGLPQIL